MRSLFFTTALFLSTATFAQQNVFAQQNDTNGLTAPKTLAPIEVRALRAAPESPFAKTELDSAALQKLNLGQDLPYLLQYTPSAVVSSDAGTGVGYSGLRIRGSDGTRINVTLNGIPVNDAESGATFFVDLPDLASSTGSVQIQRGAGSATNGPGAFGATVSVANMATSEKAGAEATVTYGSFNTQKYTLKASTGLLNNRFAMDVRLSRISSDGYIQRSASLLNALQVNAVYKTSKKSSLRFMMLQGGEVTHQAWDGVPEDSLRSNRTYNELGMKNDGSFYNNQTDNYRQNYYQLFEEAQLGKALQGSIGVFLTRGIGYYEEYHTDEAYSDYGLPNFGTPSGDTLLSTDLIRQLWLDNYNYGATGSLQYHPGRLQLTLGGALSRYDGRHYGYVTWASQGVPDHYRWYLLDAHKTDANLYLKASYPVGKRLSFYGELQARGVHHEMNGFRDNPTLDVATSAFFLNPRAGFSWLLRQGENARQRVYASVAFTGKEPIRDDYEAGLTQQPKPEYMTDVEGGYEISGGHFSAGLNAYYMRYKDQLVLTGKINDVGAYTRTNVPQSFRAGLELTVTAKPLPWLHVEGNAAFSKNRIIDFTEYIDNYDDGTQTAIDHGITDLGFSPSVVAAAGATFLPFYKSSIGRSLELTVTGKHVGMQYLDNTQNAARAIKAYTLCDVRLRYNVPLKAFSGLGLNLALNNIFNRLYESNGYTYSFIDGGATATYNYYFPQAGFNWLLGLSVKL